MFFLISIFIRCQRLTFEAVTVQVSLNIVTFNLFGFIFGFVMGNPVIAVERAGHGLGGEIHLKLAGQPEIGMTFRCILFIEQHIFVGRQSPIPIPRWKTSQLGKFLSHLGIGYIIPSTFITYLTHRQSLGRITAFVEKVAFRTVERTAIDSFHRQAVAVDIARADILEFRVSFHAAFAVPTRLNRLVQSSVSHIRDFILLGKLIRRTRT